MQSEQTKVAEVKSFETFIARHPEYENDSEQVDKFVNILNTVFNLNNIPPEARQAVYEKAHEMVSPKRVVTVDEVKKTISNISIKSPIGVPVDDTLSHLFSSDEDLDAFILDTIKGK